VNDFLRDYKPQTNAVSVDVLLGVFDRPEHLEQFMLILFLYALSRVNYLDLKVVFSQKSNFDFDLSIPACEFDCVRKQVEQHLLESLAVGVHIVLVLRSLREPLETACEFDFLHVYLVGQNLYYLVYTLLNVKHPTLFDEQVVFLAKKRVV
jgi:hypothetical protein